MVSDGSVCIKRSLKCLRLQAVINCWWRGAIINQGTQTEILRNCLTNKVIAITTETGISQNKPVWTDLQSLKFAVLIERLSPAPSLVWCGYSSVPIICMLLHLYVRTGTLSSALPDHREGLAPLVTADCLLEISAF